MSQRGLRSGEDLTIEFRPSHHAGPMVPARLVARTSEQVLLTAGIDRLYGFDPEQLNQNRQVIGRWGRGKDPVETSWSIRALCLGPVPWLLLDISDPGSHPERRLPRLHRTMPAAIRTPHFGELGALLLDVSAGGARMRTDMPFEEPDCHAIIEGAGPPIEIRAEILESIPVPGTESGTELRLKFTDMTDEDALGLSNLVERGIDDAMADLKHPHRVRELVSAGLH